MGLGSGHKRDALCYGFGLIGEEFADVGGVELGFEEEGVVTFCGVHGDVHGVDFCVFEVFDELGLFFGVEAEVGVDGEDEKAVTGFFAAGEEFFG